MSTESPRRTVLVALIVSSLCAILVSSVTVYLRPLQQANRERERKEEMGRILARLPGLEDLLGTIHEPTIETRIIEFATGKTVPSIQPDEYDPRRAASDPQQSIALPPESDIAGIGRRAKFGMVHVVRRGNAIDMLILPVHGSGYASTLYGYLALAGDLNTVVSLSFFEHGETPGMGAEIENPEWRDQWQGKRVWDAQGILRIGVAIPGTPARSGPEAPFQVDGITGATQTGRGVTNLLRFWLGDHGYGPYLKKAQSGKEIAS